MDESFSADLSSWLNATSDRYVVSEVLKDSADEVTQVVYRRDENGNASVGPFVRKRFAQDGSRGKAYRLILQAQTLGRRLEHQPIIYECEQTGGALEVVMERVPGVTLRELASSQGCGIELARRVFAPLCDAVSELHTSFEQPIIHRDIKPSNVMVANERLVLIDLGIARVYQAQAKRDTVRYGTPGYAPPEQFGYGQTSVCSDIYALGMTLAFCLIGEDPTSELRERKFAHPRIPPALQDVLCRATQFDPERRHRSAQALRDDFLHALQQTTGTSTLQPAPTHQIGSKRRWLETLGYVWNVVVVGFWMFLVLGCAAGISRPSETMAKAPLFIIILIYLGLVTIPSTAAGYLLLDKRRLRRYEPFSRLSWRIEVPSCLIIIFVSMLLTIILYNAVIRPA